MNINKIANNLINDNPSGKILLFASIFMMTGLILILEGFEIDSLVCSRTDKAPNTCKISQSTLFETTSVKEFPLSQLKEARLNKPQKSRMTTCLLVTEEGVLKFGSISSGDELQKQKIVFKINTFLQNQNQLTLSVTESPKFSIILFGIILITVALFFFYSYFYFLYSFIKLRLLRKKQK